MENFVSRNGCLPYNRKLNERAKTLRKNMTEYEKKLWFNFLRSREFTFQRQKIIGNYIVDFYSSKLQLVIEVDGESHFTNKGKEYDEQRTMFIESFGIIVLRFANSEISNNFEDVCKQITYYISNYVSSKPQTPFKKRGLRE